MFLYGESREVMMHVAGLLPFSPAPGASISNVTIVSRTYGAYIPAIAPASSTLAMRYSTLDIRASCGWAGI